MAFGAMVQHMALRSVGAAVARCAGEQLQARGCVCVVHLEFLGPNGARKSHRQCHQKMVHPGLTGWQIAILAVCDGRALSLRGRSARDPATADAAECAHAAGRGAASASAAAVWG